MNVIPCSVQVVTRNNAAGIRKCLDSLTMFDEVVVQDGYSTDGTREAAESYPNVRLMDQNRAYLNQEGRITDFASMRNESINAARHDWIFVVDGDEHVDPALIENVRQIVEKNVPGVYQAFRRFYVGGHAVMHSALYPALQIRLFHRTQTDGYVKPIHERLALKAGVHAQMLAAELPVPLPPSKDLQPKFDRYLRMEVARHGVMPWGRWFKWVFFRNLRSIAGLSVKLLCIWIIPRTGKRLPLDYEFQYLRHSWRTLVYTCPLVARKFLINIQTSPI